MRHWLQKAIPRVPNRTGEVSAWPALGSASGIDLYQALSLVIAFVITLGTAQFAGAQTTNDAVSREFSIFNTGLEAMAVDAESREMSVFNTGQSPTVIDAESREVSVFNNGQSPTSVDAVSREVSIFNNGQNVTAVDAESREVSVFNSGQPTAPVEAISREVSVFFSSNSLADLIPSIVTVPAMGAAGSTVQLTLAITNAGLTTAFGPWQNRVLLATGPNGAGAQSLGTFFFASNLYAGGYAVMTQAVILPPTAISGQYFGFFVDSASNVLEINKNNNEVFSTNTTVITTPDLDLVNEGAPDSAEFGQTINVSFAVTNIGTGVASANWNDQVYLSPSSNSIVGATLLATTAGGSPLAPGAGYVQIDTVTLPLAQSSTPGLNYLVTVVDGAGVQVEVTKTNNILSSPISLTLPPLPDLVVGQIFAPSNALPGQPVNAGWSVINQGSLNITNEAWDEVVGISNADGLISQLGVFRFTNSLNAGGMLTRNETVMLPGGVAAGSGTFYVTVNSLGDILESNPNNDTTLATNATVIPAGLSMVVPATNVLEDTAAPNLSCLVTRNGDLGVASVISLGSSATNHLVVPASVTIPAGSVSAPFTATVLDDGVVDSNALVTILATGTGYLTATAQVTVVNTDIPQLSLGPAMPHIVEGQSVTLTVTSTVAGGSPQVITIGSSSPQAFSGPATVVIPAYSNTATFTMQAVQSTVIAPSQIYTVSASANGYGEGTLGVVVLNDNTPTLTLALDRTNIDDSDGPLAAIATVSRQPVTDQPLTVALASTNPVTEVPAEIVIPGFQGSATFYVAAQPLTKVIWPQATLITAQALDIQSNAVGNLAAAGLTVQSINGPTLTLVISNKVVAKGLTPATTAVVSVNPPATNDLVVTLASDNLNEAAVPATVTIPGGTTNAVFEIDSLDDQVPFTSQTVSITASATNYASGSDEFAVTDLQLPDLVVENVSAPGALFTGQPATINFRLLNQGLAALTNGVNQYIYLSANPSSGNKSLVGSVNFPGPLAAGAYVDLSVVVPYNFIPGPGVYWALVTANVDGAAAESNTANDTGASPTPMVVSVEYTATVQADVTNVPAGTPVPLTGSATLLSGGPATNVPVNLIITVNGLPRTLGVDTDANGNFSTLFTPLATEAGTYTVTAVAPGVTNGPVQAEFNILGMTANPASLALNLSPGTGGTVNGPVNLQNVNAVPLTGLTATVSNLAANLSVTLTLATNEVEAGNSLTLVCAVTAADATIPQSTFDIHVQSAEGVTVDVPVAVTVIPQTARLVAAPGQLSTSMLEGSQTVVQFYVANTGGAVSGPVSVVTPNVTWMNVATVNPLPALNPGQSNLVTVVLTPGTNLALGPYTGTLVVDAGASSVQVPFRFDAVSDAHGGLLVQSVDEYTYFAAGSPPLTNATVTLTDPFTQSMVAIGVTGTNGTLLLPGVMAGTYNLTVTAPQHAQYQGSAVVTAGETNTVQTFLSLQTVTYTWTVVPTTVQSETEITIQAIFATDVPAPVIVPSPTSIDLSSLTQPGQYMDVPMTLANYGLIGVQNVTISINSGPYYQFNLLTPNVGNLAAKSTITVPMRVTYLGTGGGGTGNSVKTPTVRALASGNAMPRDAGDGDGGGCISVSIAWTYPCGGNNVGQSIPIPIFNAVGSCPASGGETTIVGGAGGGGPVVIPPGEASPSTCDPDPCVLARLKALLQCAIDQIEIPIKILQCGREGYECGKSINERCFGEHTTDLGCSLAIDSCLHDGIGCASVAAEGGEKEIPWIAIANCLYDVCTACAELGYTGVCGTQPPSGPPTPEVVSRVLQSKSVSAKSVSVPVGQDADVIFGPLFTEANDLVEVMAPYQYFFNNNNWFGVTDTNSLETILDQFDSDTETNSDGGHYVTDAERMTLEALPLPVPLQTADVDSLVNRWNSTMSNYDAGIFTTNQVPEGGITNFIDFGEWISLNGTAQQILQTYNNEGYSDPGAALVATHDAILAEYQNGEKGVCAEITLQIDQTAVLTLNAFHATLQLNDNGSDTLSNILVNVQIQDQNGNNANGLFSIGSPALTGALGAVDGTGMLNAGQSGSAQWTLIPTAAAAPQTATGYSVSGTLSYVDGGLTVTIPLAPTAITVQPSPQLYLKYFLQHDVYSDNPFTPVIEPSIPFPLAVLVENQGAGTASNFQITSAQPQIVDNQKGLLIGFNIIGAQVDNQPVTPSLTANFGNIQPGQNEVGVWYLTSTLDGQFINYKATYQAIDPLGATSVSPITGVEIHAMTHLVRADGAWDDGLPDFLVNDIPNVNNFPDTLYLNDGTVQPVSVVQAGMTSGPVTAGNLQTQFTANFPAGFTYLVVPDPTAGQYTLTNVLRMDGTSLFTNDFWTTARTFQGIGQPPTLVTNLHLFVYHTNAGPDTFTLEYAAPSTAAWTNPPVSSVFALPAQSPPTFGVVWSGEPLAGGLPIAYYDIYASDDGGAFAVWQSHTTAMSAEYNGLEGHTYAFYSVSTDTGGNRETTPLQAQAETLVGTITNPPTITLASNAVVMAGQTLNVSVSAADVNPLATLAFSLGAGAPAGVTVNPATGRITWSTSPLFGGTTNRISVIVTDNNQPPLSATGMVNVVVQQIINPPLLAPIPNFRIFEATQFAYTNLASDPNVPALPLTFSLGAGAPKNATIDPVTGVFQWQPTSAQAPSTNVFPVIVTDTSTPPLSATQQFTVVVMPVAFEWALNLGSTGVLAGTTSSIPVTLLSSLPLTNLTVAVQIPSSLLTNFSLQPAASEILSTRLQPLGTNQYVLSLSLDPSQSPGGSRTVAQLGFAAVAQTNSVIVQVPLSGLVGTENNGLTAPKPAAFGGRVFIVANQPLLDAWLSTNGQRMLMVYGDPGTNYVLYSSTNLGATNWQNGGSVLLTNVNQYFNVTSPVPQLFYKAGTQ